MPRKKKNKKSLNTLQKLCIGVVSIWALLFIIPTSRHVMVKYLWEIRSNFTTSSRFVFGIDVSHYQRKINWNSVSVSKHPIEYVFIRATMGADRRDEQYAYNWEEVKKYGWIRGAYHYYDPRQNSSLQAANFIASVKLEKGDLPPVLDIEQLSPYGNENLLKGIKNWLAIVEMHYKVKPILYTGLKFHEDHLEDEIKGHHLWVAAYKYPKHRLNVDWKFHQFTDKVNVYGIPSRVDGNDFNGSREELEELLLH